MLAVWACLVAGLAPALQARADDAFHCPTYATLPEVGATRDAAVHVLVPTGAFQTSSMVKVPRWSPVPVAALPRATQGLMVGSVRGGRASAQLAVSSRRTIRRLAVTVTDLTSRSGRIPAADVQVRYVGYIRLQDRDPRAGGASLQSIRSCAVADVDGRLVVADPLFGALPAPVAPYQLQPVWFTFHVPASAAAGTYSGTVTMTIDGTTPVRIPITERVYDVGDASSPADGLALNLWLNPFALSGVYHVAPGSPAFARILKPYLAMLHGAGQRIINASIVDRPWRADWNGYQPQTRFPYASMVKWTRNGQAWSFDFGAFDRYVEESIHAGLGPRIDVYSLLSFRGPQRLTYLDAATHAVVDRTVKLGSPEWTAAWTAFLQQFSAHLRERGWLSHTWLAFDEQTVPRMRAAMALVRQAAPGFLARIEVAGSWSMAPFATDLAVGLDGLRQAPPGRIDARAHRGRLTSFYVWAGDGYPNTLTFSPAVDARAMGWIAASRGLNGYLHWAFNDWTPDVFSKPVFAYSQGDEYLVYPGPHGPISSIRWELLRDGIQDYRLGMLARGSGVPSATVRNIVGGAVAHAYGPAETPRDIEDAYLSLVQVLAARHAGATGRAATP